MATTITLTNGDKLNLKSARAELGLKAIHLADLKSAHDSTLLDLGRYLVEVRDSNLGQAALTVAELKDGRTNGFSVWYTGLGYDKAEVSRWIRFAETVDSSPIDLSAMPQGTVLALATAKPEDHAEIIERAESTSSPDVRVARSAIEAERNPDPGPTLSDDNDDDDDDDDTGTQLDDIIDDIGTLAPDTTMHTHNADDLMGAINTLIGFHNALTEAN